MGNKSNEPDNARNLNLVNRISSAIARFWGFFKKYYGIGIFFIIVITITYIVIVDKQEFSQFDERTKIKVTSIAYHFGLRFWDAMNYPDAEKYLIIAKEEISAQKSQDSLELAEINQKLGALYLEMGRYDDSYEPLNSAYITFRNALGERNFRTILAKCQIHNYDLKTGDAERGLAGIIEAYTQSESTSWQIEIAGLLIEAYIEYGNYTEALNWYNVIKNEHALAFQQVPQQVALLNDIGLLMNSVGEYRLSLDAYKNAINAWESYATKDDAIIANVFANMAIAHAFLDEYDEALSTGNRAGDIYRTLFGEDTVHLIRVYQNLGMIYGEQHVPAMQFEYIEKALDIAIETVGEYHIFTASVYGSFSDYYAAEGDIPTAIDYAEMALQIQKDILAVEKISIAYSGIRLCMLNYRDHDNDKAIKNGTFAIELIEDLIGENNVHAGEAYLRIARPYADIGQLGIALEYAQRGFDCMVNYAGGSVWRMAFAHMMLGYVQGKNEMYIDAEINLRKAVQLFSDLDGTDSADCTTAQRYLDDLFQQRRESIFQDIRTVLSPYTPDPNHLALRRDIDG